MTPVPRPRPNLDHGSAIITVTIPLTGVDSELHGKQMPHSASWGRLPREPADDLTAGGVQGVEKTENFESTWKLWADGHCSYHGHLAFVGGAHKEEITELCVCLEAAAALQERSPENDLRISRNQHLEIRFEKDRRDGDHKPMLIPIGEGTESTHSLASGSALIRLVPLHECPLMLCGPWEPHLSLVPKARTGSRKRELDVSSESFLEVWAISLGDDPCKMIESSPVVVESISEQDPMPRCKDGRRGGSHGDVSEAADSTDVGRSVNGKRQFFLGGGSDLWLGLSYPADLLLQGICVFFAPRELLVDAT